MSGSIKISRKVKGFAGVEKLVVTADDYFDAFYKLGKEVSNQVKDVFCDLTKNFSASKMAEELSIAQKRLEFMERVSEKGWLKVGGVNYLQRYLNAFYGTAKGVGLGYTESMMIQSESVGCQTVMVQDKKTGEIRMIHAEEDSSFERKKDEYRYRWVDLTVGSNQIEFFYYPELYGFGPAIGVNKTTGMVVAIDDLIAKTEFGSGNFSVMAVAFMILDCGEIRIAEELIDCLIRIDGLTLEGAYAIHMAQTGEPPRMRSVECIHNIFKYEGYEETKDRVYSVQSNYAVNKELIPMVCASVPIEGEWSLGDAKFYGEMTERRKRLSRQAIEIDWLGETPEESVRKGLELLASPEGDTSEYVDEKGKLQRVYTGLPSPWVVAHFSAYIGRSELGFEIGKYLPKPIKGREYEVKYRSEYKYGGKNLTEMANREMERYLKKTT